jgi:TolA-binding protein
MRFRYSLAVLGIALTTTVAMAQPAQPPAANDWTGPVVGGRHRQPTPAEVQARQQAEGQTAKTIEQRNRDQDKTIDDLYNELMKPVPSRDMSGEQGQAPR